MRSRRARFAALASLLLVARVQAAIPPPRVALVMSGDVGPFEVASQAMRRRLATGPTPPELVLFSLDSEEIGAERVRREVRDAAPAVIVTVGTVATRVMLRESWEVPIVYSMVLHPASSGIAARPGRNLTGAMLDIPFAAQFETLRMLLPDAERIGVLHSKETREEVAAAGRAAEARGFALRTVVVERPADVARAVERLLPEVDALWSVADPAVFTRDTSQAIVLAALRARVPFFGLSAAQVRSGALVALSCDYAAVGEQTANLVTALLGGRSVETLPPVHPKTWELHVNVRTARHIGLTVPDAMIQDAATVVE